MAYIVATDEGDASTFSSPELNSIFSVSDSTYGQLLENVRKPAIGDESPHEPRKHEERTSVPFVLSFDNLTYNVSVRPKLEFRNLIRRRKTEDSEFALTEKPSTKTLLDNISGKTRDGEIMAVLGASGSGKSTLIDALANRIAKGSLKGTVKLNGETLQSRMLKVISAYVMQDDLLFPMLTVEETLMFAADFRLPRSLPRSKKKLRVQALIDQLGIGNAAKTIIGDEGHRGISGGERRRVSIGIDIIHDPILLFLDEPTSGLDSTSAFMVVNVLKKIAQSGSIVIMSIHQPSHRVLGLLDRLIFLSRGHTVYSGSPASLPRFFADFGYPVPENENITEFALDFIRELEGSARGTRALVEFNQKWQKTTPPSSPHANLTLQEAIAASISRGKLVSGGQSTTLAVPAFANPMWTEIITLSKRSMLNSRRQPELFAIKLASVVITGFILATVFWRLDNTPKGIRERLGFLTFATSTMYYTCVDALPDFLQERYIFMRETAYNTYRRSSYVLSHAIVSLPSLIVFTLAFAVPTFWAVGLDGGPMGLLFYCLIIFASFWSGSSFVTLISAIVPNVMIGYTISVAILAYFLLFNGFFINRNRIPDYWIWFHYMSLLKYSYEAVMQNEFSDATKCFVRGVQTFDNTLLEKLPYEMKLSMLDTASQSLGTGITSSSCLTTGADILKNQGVTLLSKWDCLLITVASGFLFRVLFYFSLLLGSKNKRK